VPDHYIDKRTLRDALAHLYGTANHLLKIWLTLKQMGFGEGKPPVVVTTSSPDAALNRLFDFGSQEGNLYVPFAHTSRFLTMEGDAGRSIIQTNIQRWKTSGSVVTCDPTGFLDIHTDDDDRLLVSPQRSYPLGLGLGANGFALKDGTRVSLPGASFAIWYFRQKPVPVTKAGKVDHTELIDLLKKNLGISAVEYETIFVADHIEVTTQASPLTNPELFEICSTFLEHPGRPIAEIQPQTFDSHATRIRSMKTVSDKPTWLNRSPQETLAKLLESGDKAILLYGPPRTGKTRAIDTVAPRNTFARETIQIHDGWTYDNLVEAFRPDGKAAWGWEDGPLKAAILGGKEYVVLEEINRTSFTQAVGEIFSLIEGAYRGPDYSIRLRSGKAFFIPESTVFLMTMNTLDKSTEDIDDAMMGRFSAVEFPPRVEDLTDILESQHISNEMSDRLRELFAFIVDYYPLGQGYFASLNPQTEFITYYLGRIRPVLENHFRNFRPENLALIDNKVDALFAK
jgi:5-methylcytosine-specific restriction enzyme B